MSRMNPLRPERRRRNASNLLPGVSLRHRTVYCPTHYVLSGIKGKGGDYVDRINSIRCTRFRGDKVSFRNVGIGGTGGRVGRLYCTGADRVSRIRVRFGSWIDWLSVECRGQ